MDIMHHLEKVTMASKLLQLALTQFLVTKAISSLVPPYSVNQYGPASRPNAQKMPSSYPPSPYHPNYKAFYTQQYPTQYYPAYQNVPEPNPVSIQQVKQLIRPQIEPQLLPKSLPNSNPPIIPKEVGTPKKNHGRIDSHVLNNLAIALQLLIVNNILNNPSECHEHIPTVSDSIMELVLPNGNSIGQQMPNSKFLGTSGFTQDNIMSQPMLSSYGISSSMPSSRPGFNLMSPYDAIAKSAPFAESLVSSYMAKNDFQSPYAAIMAADNNNDLFSMSDLFS